MQRTFLSQGIVAQTALIIGAFLTLVSAGLFFIPLSTTPQADMVINPKVGRVAFGDTFTVHIIVSAQVPVNVFRGEVLFNPDAVQVVSINYNTSIANLWAELPWYANGEGTLNFTGGTTKQGGFTGTGNLIDITFRATGHGVTALKLADVRILAHDGLGSDVILEKPIDALFTVDEATIAQQTVAAPSSRTAVVAVDAEAPSTDLNGDGKQTIADISIFMLHSLQNNPRYDFNQDGNVDNTDLSILMSAH